MKKLIPLEKLKYKICEDEECLDNYDNVFQYEIEKVIEKGFGVLNEKINKVEKIEKSLKSYIANKIAKKIINNFI